MKITKTLIKEIVRRWLVHNKVISSPTRSANSSLIKSTDTGVWKTLSGALRGWRFSFLKSGLKIKMKCHSLRIICSESSVIQIRISTSRFSYWKLWQTTQSYSSPMQISGSSPFATTWSENKAEAKVSTISFVISAPCSSLGTMCHRWTMILNYFSQKLSMPL